MKYLSRAVAVLLPLSAVGAQAQTVPVAPQAQRLDAGSILAVAQAAVASSSVATVTVPSNQVAYITAIEVDGCQNGTGAAVTNGNITSTGFNSITANNPSWSFSMALTANGCFTGGIVRFYPSTPVKAVPGTNVVITSPATSGWQYTIRVYGYLNAT